MFHVVRRRFDAPSPRRRSLIVAVLAGVLVGAVLAPVVVSAATGTDPGGSLYKPRAVQCVLFNTRIVAGGPIGAGTTRTFDLTGDLTGQGGDPGCEVAAEATGYHLNLIAREPTGAGNLKAWPANEVEPNGGIVNFVDRSNSNAFMVSMDPTGLNVKATNATAHAKGILLGELFDADSRYAITTDVAVLESRVTNLETPQTQEPAEVLFFSERDWFVDCPPNDLCPYPTQTYPLDSNGFLISSITLTADGPYGGLVGLALHLLGPTGDRNFEFDAPADSYRALQHFTFPEPLLAATMELVGTGCASPNPEDPEAFCGSYKVTVVGRRLGS
jgi:hypothetical protein